MGVTSCHCYHLFPFAPVVRALRAFRLVLLLVSREPAKAGPGWRDRWRVLHTMRRRASHQKSNQSAASHSAPTTAGNTPSERENFVMRAGASEEGTAPRPNTGRPEAGPRPGRCELFFALYPPLVALSADDAARGFHNDVMSPCYRPRSSRMSWYVACVMACSGLRLQ